MLLRIMIFSSVNNFETQLLDEKDVPEKYDRRRLR